MTERFIPLHDARRVARPVVPARTMADPLHGPIRDSRSRWLRDLRISVTDRCNFRCTYCMPKDVFDKAYPFLHHRDLLRFEEIERLASVFVGLGVEKIRLTGGEPLLRRDIEALIALLSKLQTPSGRRIDLTLTTNGSLLKRKAQTLADAGLKRVTVSLDALDDARFRAMNDVDFPVRDVLAGIEAAEQAGLGPIKINMVVKRGVNEDQIEPMAAHFRGSGHILRFIEFMDVGASNGWRLDDVVPSAEVLQRLHARWPVEALDPQYPGEVAERWRYRDGGGEIGVISSVTQAFCNSCTRARLSTDGQLFLCLFAQRGFDLRALLRDGATDDDIARALHAIWEARDDQYSVLRSSATAAMPKIEMSYIGG